MQPRGHCVRSNQEFIVFAVAIVLMFAFRGFAETPTLDGFYPAGGERGTTNSVTAAGKFGSWPPHVWISSPGLTFTAETNKGKFSVTIAVNAPPGPRLIRLYNEDGASDPRFFVVGTGRESTETEPNNHFAKAQPIPELPATINGRLDKNGDVDSFAIHLRAGEWLDASVDSYTLMSKVDAVLRLVTTNGQQLTWNHDFITLDPRLGWRASEEGTVVLQTFGFAYPPGSDIGFTGGEAIAYRLHLALTNAAGGCESAGGTNANRNGQIPGPVTLPAAIRGTISNGTQEDRFRFTAEKNEFIEASADAASFGSPLDAWLKIEDTDGNQLARNDDADGSRDPSLEWKVPTNGTFVLALGSVTHRGGKEFCYRLNVKQAEPDFRASLSANSLVLASAATNDLKIEFKRLRGFTNELAISVRDLPSGVAFIPTNLPAKEGSASLRLIAEREAPPFQGPIRIVVTNAATKQDRIAPFDLVTRGETGFAHLLVETDDHFWLTVRPKAKNTEKPRSE